jgi:hypothetical protein
MPSAEELAERAGSPLPEDEYLAEVTEVTIDKDNVNPYTKEVRDQLKVKFTIHSFADGTELVDVEGKPLDSYTLTAFIDPSKVGMKPQVSRARKFFTAAMGVPVGSAIDISGPDELIGKRLVIGTINKPSKDNPNVSYTRAQDYKPIKKQRPVRQAPAPITPETEGDDEVAF